MVKKASQPVPPKSKKPDVVTAGEPDSGRPLIQSRQIVGHDIKVSGPVQDGQRPALSPATPPATPPPSKRTIMPITISDGSRPEEPAAPSPDQPAEPVAPKPNVDPPAPDIAKDAQPTPEEKPEEPNEPEDTGEEVSELSGNTAAGAVDPDLKPTPETEKALKEAAEAAKREQKLQHYIDNRHFFVPINAVARKRSIKVSGLLTFFTLVLAFLLIDLMLDSGIILLLQKIPHTHFFSLGG